VREKKRHRLTATAMQGQLKTLNEATEEEEERGWEREREREKKGRKKTKKSPRCIAVCHLLVVKAH